jgi:HEAT repeat protein
MAARRDTDFELAMLDAYSALVRALDRSGVLRAQVVTDALHGAAEVRRKDADIEVANGLHRLRNKLIEEIRAEHPPLKVA